ncbi:hypothetical protein HWQ46_25375 [Shewanella sp. D64]|uniref:DUF6890 family protein n=1 Tax=unclassified Shewanella TaxID=196818 RepID=UPI0022BA2333|nr:MULTISPECIES: hypothetical protein [unclassified Shewanella]MEC4728850.1 hypothetical protein [Shewanella sp. D64]MEC4740724.1 hypothetical protein [Shewanella sp. E94]WBJ95317.1 hypothetical protein HWQ47_26610 [Shewanella sp. MTB7]
MVGTYRKNSLSQAQALRAHFLPHETDCVDSLAKAIWLDEHFTHAMTMAVNKGAGLLFK